MDSIHLQPKFRKFKELRCLKFDYSRMANEDEMFLSILKASNTKYHNTCQSSYSDNKVKRFRLSNEKQLAKASRKESENEVPQNWSRRSAEEPKPSHANKLQCYWCTQFHDEANLWAAGERWTKTKLNSEDVKTTTHKWKEMAAVIKHNHIYGLLSHGDVSNNECEDS